MSKLLPQRRIWFCLIGIRSSAVLGVINGFTDTIVTNNIPAGIQYQTIPEGIAVNPVTGKIYVVDFGFTAPDQVIVLKIPDDKLSER